METSNKNAHHGVGWHDITGRIYCNTFSLSIQSDIIIIPSKEFKMCGCQGKKKPPSPTPSSTLTSSGNFTQDSLNTITQTGDKNQMVTLEYVGPLRETFTITSRIDRNIRYRFGNNETHRSRPVLLGDAEYLLGMGDENNRPTYRIVSVGAGEEALDPAAFLGQPITA